MGMNNELPREEQMRIVLQNYDKLSAKCNALKEDNAKLQSDKKKLEEELAQSKTVYKNMLARFEGRQDKKQRDFWEGKYNELNKKYEKKNKKYVELDRRFKILNGCFGNVVGYVSKAYNQMTAVKTKMAYDLEAMTYNDDDADKGFSHEVVPDVPLTMPVDEEKEETPVSPKSFVDFQELQFIKYVRAICKSFHETGSLRGIAQMARNAHVTSLKKEQFFQFDLNNEPLTDEYIISVYNQIKKR